LLLDDDDELTEEVSAAEAALSAKLGAEGLASIDERLIAQPDGRRHTEEPDVRSTSPVL
jgi:hypothetical protein